MHSGLLKTWLPQIHFRFPNNLMNLADNFVGVAEHPLRLVKTVSPAQRHADGNNHNIIDSAVSAVDPQFKKNLSASN